MKKLIQMTKSASGFTLIEVIVTITIAAILASFLITFMGTAITKSSDPIKQTRELGNTSGYIEKISADYSTYLKTGTPNWWTTFKGKFTDNTYPNPPYTCTTLTSGVFGSVETLVVTVTVGNQKLVTYLMQ